MESIGIVLFIILISAVASASKKARKQAQSQTERRTPGYSPRPRAPVTPRRELRDVVNQVMEQAGLEHIDKRPPIETEFVGEDTPQYGLAPSHVPLSSYAQGESFQDTLDRVGGSMFYDSPEGMEFPSHIHTNAASDYEPSDVWEPTGVYARLTSRQALHALVMAEVLSKPVSMRRGGMRR